MRSAAGVIVGLWLAVQVGAASAETCVDTSQNNTAFSSSYLAGQAPCKPHPRQGAEPTKPQAPRAGNPKNAAAPVADIDGKPHIVPTEHGTLIKAGETSVCISGSVSTSIYAGNSVGAALPRPGRAPACE